MCLNFYYTVNYVKECTTCFPLRALQFMTLHKSLIHFEFIFVFGIRKCSNFILLHVVVQFFQHHLLTRLFAPLCILASFVKGKVPITAWVYLQDFYLVTLICISAFVPVPYCLGSRSFVVQSEVREVDSTSSILFSQDCFTYSGSFVFPYRLLIFLFQFWRKTSLAI